MSELKMDRKERGETEPHSDHGYRLFKEFVDYLTKVYEQNRNSSKDLKRELKDLIKTGKDMVQKLHGLLQDQARFA